MLYCLYSEKSNEHSLTIVSSQDHGFNVFRKTSSLKKGPNRNSKRDDKNVSMTTGTLIYLICEATVATSSDD